MTRPTLADLDPNGELGLDSTMTVDAVGTLETVAPGAHGLRSATPLAAIERELDEHRAAGTLDELFVDRRDVRSDLLPREAARVIESVLVPSVRAIVKARGAVRLSGAWEEIGDLLIADATRGRATARVTSDVGEFVIDLGATPPRVVRIVAHDASPLPPMREEAHVDPPALAELTGDLETAPWLAELYAEHVGSPRRLLRLAAVGALGRLWSAKALAARTLAERAFAGEPLPVDRARAWARGNAAAIREALAVAVVEAEDVTELLDGAPASLGAELEPALRSLVDRRDDLESFAFLARAVGEGGAIDGALGSLDRVAITQASLLDVELDLGGEARYREVLSTEPFAWWGLLARQR